MVTPLTYDKQPFTPAGPANACESGWKAIVERLQGLRSRPRCVLTVECYPGVHLDEVRRALSEGLRPVLVVDVRQAYKDANEVDRMCAPYLGDDPVFGRMNLLTLGDFLDPGRTAVLRGRIEAARSGLVLVVGAGAALVAPPDVLVHADLARWEIQRRQRRHEVASLGVHDQRERAGRLYKRGFFVDWRAADRLKRELLERIDWLLDTNDPAAPKLVAGDDFRQALAAAVRRPLRLVPFFDPAPWGGQWMKEALDLPREEPNYGWGFDCVPEENSLLLGFGTTRVEVPALDLVFRHPRELLGEAVHARFGTEFPIRFDLLDTMGGANLPLQVHPLTEYIQDRFGMHYTQDESYYVLDAAEGSSVLLGLKEGVDRSAMVRDLRRAQSDGFAFADGQYVNRWPARKHGHYLIPAGTVHAAGANCMVLEIGATPFLFTFKLWDWQRPDPEGARRPTQLEHGLASIRWDRSASWVERELLDKVEPVGSGEDWREERTGLHEREFVETRRHWFTGPVPHDTGGGVNVLNLVEGAEAIVESPTGAFEPLVVHYAETFVVPATIGAYSIRPQGAAEGHECATIKAFVRTRS
jgi:hypothetical protein